MDDLPLELKQRICSYLTPKDLKSLRWASNDYAAAAPRYMMPRIFLSNHPSSFQEIQKITDHPEMRYSVTTLVIDTRCLSLAPKYDQWARRFADTDPESTDKNVARAERILRREKNREQWSKHQDLALAQRNSRQLMLDSIALAVRKCPKLCNLIIQHHEKQEHGLRRPKKQDYFYQGLNLTIGKHSRYRWASAFESMRFSIWDLLRPFHVVDRALNSLVILDQYLRYPQGWNMPTTTIFQNLKHLRHLGGFSTFLSHIVARAPELESIGVLGTDEGWNACALQVLIGGTVLGKLRGCSLNRLAHGQDDLAEFLLRQFNTLQHLRITNESRNSSMDWNAFLSRVQGQLPNLRRVEISALKQYAPQWTPQHGWGAPPPITGADLLRDHAHDLETGPMEIENGLWEDYEEQFFPEKSKS